MSMDVINKVLRKLDGLELSSNERSQAFSDALTELGLVVAPLCPSKDMCVAGIKAMDACAASTATTAVIYGEPREVYQAMIENWLTPVGGQA